MGVDLTKHVAYALIGANDGAGVSKFVAYVLLEPGAEEGADPEPRQGFTYAQTLRRPQEE